ncbi:MAG: valine--tRNA ligase [Phycisphaerales bacterium]
MTTEPQQLDKQYRPLDHETRIWEKWIGAKSFHADPARVVAGEAKPYSVLIPPPNVTAALHLGHALNNTLQDVLVRAKRMMGFETLWMPGTDHAGIATQAVVEKRVMAEEKKRRTDFGRDEFVAKIQAFKDEYEAVITGQLKRMGCSCDWDRQRFTMDDVCVGAVREAFYRLFKDGLIYRGKRLVNWDPALQTAVADDECYEEEIDGSFYYLRYPLVHMRGADTQHERLAGKMAPRDAVPVTWDELAARGYPGAEEHPADQPAWITVATTRPETYLGDTAVAVNPHDPRAMSLRHLYVELPLVGRVIPVVEDNYVVLPERYARNEEEKNDPKAKMATGFLKVTPAHDPNDYEIGIRHSLERVNVLAPDGTISDKHGWTDVGDAHLLVGKKREEARKLVVREFEALGLFEGAKPHRHSVKHSDRSKAIIEPYLSDQWYVKVTDDRLAPAANRALVREQRTHRAEAAGAATDGELRFHPARYAKSFEQWHDNIRDWCISRQLWWGHRIPVWSTVKESVESACARLAKFIERDRVAVTGSADGVTTYVCIRGDADTDAEALLADPALGYHRDSDVLDTWFSSALWPISTMGWPNPDARTAGLLEAFNPSSTLCTAREIITLWVSRMVMFNRYFRGEGGGKGTLPFSDVFIHAVVQDGDGRKMSKSLGNGVDPLDIIASHGADAMRFTLCKMSTNTQDVRMPVTKDAASGKNTSPKFDEGRNFANKLWNAARYAMGILQQGKAEPVVSVAGLPLADRWMLSRLAGAVRACSESLDRYEYADYAVALYDLLWRDFCDWYLEAIKPTVAENAGQRAVLRASLDVILRLLHPVMPFVTEAIFERLSEMPSAGVAGLSLVGKDKGSLLATAGWPVAGEFLIDPKAEAEFEKLRGLITAVRELRAQHNVPPKRRVSLHLNAAAADLGDYGRLLVGSLAQVGTITHDAPGGASVAFTYDALEHRLSDLADAVDADAERARLGKLAADLDKSIATLEGRLANPGYALKAPPSMVQQTQDQLAKAKAERDAARQSLERLG